jgi:hypothetical protein
MNTQESSPEGDVIDIENEEENREGHADEAVQEKRPNSRAEEERAYYVGWAEALGKDTEWVDRTFTFAENGTVTCEGDLDLRGVEELTSFPADLTEVKGNLDLRDVTTLTDMHFYQKVGGSLYLCKVHTLTNVTLPEHVGGMMDLSELYTAENLVLPQHVGGGVRLDMLSTLEGVTMPTDVGGDVYLQGLEDWERSKLCEEGYSYSERIL